MIEESKRRNMFYVTLLLIYLALGIAEGVAFVYTVGIVMSQRHRLAATAVIALFWPAYIALSIGYTYSSDIRSAILAYLDYLDKGQ